MNLGFSKTLAIIFGTALPLLGIVRFFITQNDPAVFFVDLIAGTFLLVGAWRVGEAAHSGQRYLAAAWGLSIGLLYSSLYAQVQLIYRPITLDVPSSELEIAATILTAFGLFMASLGLIACLRSARKH